MICSEPNPISGEWNRVFEQRLVRYKKCGKSFTEGGNKREIKGQIRVVLRLVSLVLFTVEKKNLLRRGKREQIRQANPETNNSEDNFFMTRLWRTTHDIQQYPIFTAERDDPHGWYTN